MTLTQLAQELNLSIATISRALNQPTVVAPRTRQRVLSAVHSNGYIPNGSKRALRTQQTRTIGVIVSDIRNYFFASVVKCVDDIARAMTELLSDENARDHYAELGKAQVKNFSWEQTALKTLEVYREVLS